MSYMHIANLYAEQDILMFKECFALEKVHGTSTHVGWSEGQLFFFSGGEKQAKFTALFDHQRLVELFTALGHPKITVYGEGYGGSCQGMGHTYGTDFRFIAFEVKIGDSWLSVPDAEQVATGLGLEFVPYERIQTTMEAIDKQRDAESIVAARRGISGKVREGVVLRPIMELRKNNGERIVAKHKGEAFSERVHTPKVTPDKLVVMAEANAIADEWVTEMRLAHVLDAFPNASIQETGNIIKAMIEDVEREAAGEIVKSKEARAAIGKRTAQMFKRRLESVLKNP